MAMTSCRLVSACSTCWDISDLVVSRSDVLASLVQQSESTGSSIVPLAFQDQTISDWLDPDGVHVADVPPHRLLEAVKVCKLDLYSARYIVTISSACVYQPWMQPNIRS